MPSFTPFQRHLLFFADGRPGRDITILSATRASLRLGFGLPIAFLTALAIPLLYHGIPFISPVRVNSIPQSLQRSQIETAELTRDLYTQADILDMYDGRGHSWFSQQCDKGHLKGFVALAQDHKTGLVSVEDVKRFQTGDWLDRIVERRRSRRPGKGEILPFSVGGPGLVGAHCTGTKMLFGIDVYEDK